jgi:hypothetical protein
MLQHIMNWDDLRIFRAVAQAGSLNRVLNLDKALAADLLVLRHPLHRDTARMRAFSDFVPDRLVVLL